MTTYYARVDYTYQGGDRIFSIPFSYIKKAYINVLINEVPTEAYTYLNATQILISDSVLSVGDMVAITRTTPIDERLVVFSDTSILKKDVQNLAQEQVFDVVQEIYDNNARVTTAVNNAVSLSTEALEVAEEANSKSDLAIQTAQRAEDNSETAIETANSAVSSANSAVQTANNAEQIAATASNIANKSSNKVDEFGESIDTVIEAASKINELEEAIEQAKEYADLAGRGFGFRIVRATDWEQEGNRYKLTLPFPIVLGLYTARKELLSSANICMDNDRSVITSLENINGYVLVSAKNVENEDDNPIEEDDLSSMEVTDWDDI